MNANKRKVEESTMGEKSPDKATLVAIGVSVFAAIVTVALGAGVITLYNRVVDLNTKVTKSESIIKEVTQGQIQEAKDQVQAEADEKKKEIRNLLEGFALLSNKDCPSGFVSVEDGYIKLGKKVTLKAKGSNERNIDHQHSAGGLYAAIVFGGDAGNMSIANRRIDGASTFESTRSMPLPGKFGKGGGRGYKPTAVQGLTDNMNRNNQINIEPRHIVLRLCLKKEEEK